MTLPLPICFSRSALALLARVCLIGLLVDAMAGAAVVRGAVELVDSHDPGVRKHNDYSGVVVWLERAGAADDSAPTANVRTFEMRQKDKAFVPHVLAIPVGSSVSFPNLDPIFHNAFSSYNGQVFDVGLYRPGSIRTVLFHREGVVRVFCNIHPTMSAVILVLRSSYSSVTGKSGAFEITGVPAGEYRLRAFHERAAGEALQSIERRVIVEDFLLELAPLRISESGYLPEAHLNKYGKPYPPVIEDRRVYGGADK